MGISGDTATAAPATTVAPMAAATPTLINPAAISCRRVTPGASGRIAFWTEVAWVPTSAASVRPRRRETGA